MARGTLSRLVTRIVARLLRRLGWVSEPDLDYAALAEERFGALPGAPLVVLGDSHVQDGPFSEFLGTVARRGIGGATIERVTDMVPHAVPPEAQTLVVVAGTNDTALGHEPEKVEADAARLISTVRSHAPAAAIAFVGALPPEGHHDHVGVVNDAIRAACEREEVPFFDPTEEIAPAGPIAAELTTDGTHLNAVGYSRLGRVLLRAARSVR